MDRSPTGSGVTARIALQYHKGLIQLNQTRTFKSGATGSLFTGKPVEVPECFFSVLEEVASGLCSYRCRLAASTTREDRGNNAKIRFVCKYVVVFVCVQETSCGDFKAVVVEVAGRAFYTGVSSFVQEADDNLTQGFLLK